MHDISIITVHMNKCTQFYCWFEL